MTVKTRLRKDNQTRRSGSQYGGLQTLPLNEQVGDLDMHIASVRHAHVELLGTLEKGCPGGKPVQPTSHLVLCADPPRMWDDGWTPTNKERALILIASTTQVRVKGSTHW
jgi:hypothetical protein